ncbi:hypothetical protein Tco_0471549 [Tanacetum coccineum]
MNDKTMMIEKALQLGSNLGRSIKKRRSDSAASGSAKPPPKDDDQSSQKPRESDASASKQHPSFTSTGWQITDTRDTIKGRIRHGDTDNLTFPRRTGKKKLCKADLEGPAFNLAKAFHKNSVFLQYQMDECHKLLTNKVDWSNPEGHQILRNIYEPLPLGGPPGQVNLERPNWDATDYYFKEDYTIVPKPRAVVYRDRNNQRKLMRLNELHKFSDGTLTRVMEKLDQMVKDFHLFRIHKAWRPDMDIVKMEMEMEIPSS